MEKGIAGCRAHLFFLTSKVLLGTQEDPCISHVSRGHSLERATGRKGSRRLARSPMTSRLSVCLWMSQPNKRHRGLIRSRFQTTETSSGKSFSACTETSSRRFPASSKMPRAGGSRTTATTASSEMRNLSLRRSGREKRPPMTNKGFASAEPFTFIEFAAKLKICYIFNTVIYLRS
jgi:hypothetical protein